MSLDRVRPCMSPPATCHHLGNAVSGSLTALLGTNHLPETVTNCGIRCPLVPHSFMASNGLPRCTSLATGRGSHDEDWELLGAPEP